jgi:hypothetical protein
MALPVRRGKCAYRGLQYILGMIPILPDLLPDLLPPAAHAPGYLSHLSKQAGTGRGERIRTSGLYVPNEVFTVLEPVRRVHLVYIYPLESTSCGLVR